MLIFFQHEPNKRPSIKEILQDDFMTMGYLPSRLPVSCLTMAPKFDRPNMSMIAAQPQQRGPLTELNTDRRTHPNGLGGSTKKPGSGEPTDSYLSELYRQLKAVVDSKPMNKVI